MASAPKRRTAMQELLELEACNAALRQKVSDLSGVASDVPITSTTALKVCIERPRVGVGAVITCDAHPGCVLIGERKGSHGAGKWALPGGHLEHGESWATTCFREVEEETALVVAEARWAFAAVTNDVMPDDGLHYITIFMHAAVTPDEAAAVRNVEEDKCLGWHWLPWEDVARKPLFVPLRNFIDGGNHARFLGSQ